MNKSDVMDMIESRLALCDMTTQKIREINHYRRQVKREITALQIVNDMMESCNPDNACIMLQDAIGCNESDIHALRMFQEKNRIDGRQRADMPVKRINDKFVKCK